MNSYKHPSCTSLGCRGFSLVELMVALVITLILLAGIGQIFLGSKKSFNIQDSLGRMQENGRYAMETMIADLRRAGYWGGNTDVAAIGGTTGILSDTGTCTAGNTDWIRMLDRRIFGTNNSKGGYGCISSTGTAAYARGDILVIRYAAPWKVGGITSPTYDNGRLYLRTSLFRGALFTGDKQDPATYTANEVTGAAVRTAELIGHAYYIGDSALTCPAGVAVPALYRRTIDASGALVSEEIASGVDHLQVQFGIDEEITASNPRGDDTVNRYLDANAVTDWDQVIATRLWLLVRSECPETGYTNSNSYELGDLTGTGAYTPNDSYRRQLYTSTVRLRNSNFN